MKYVTLCDAKAHLRVDHDEDDIDIDAKIVQASSLVKGYIKTTSPYEPSRDANDDIVLDSNGDIEDANAYTIRYEVQAATLLMVQHLYERDPTTPVQHGYLPEAVISLLYPLRDPTFS